jgi:hypothetical protein
MYMHLYTYIFKAIIQDVQETFRDIRFDIPLRGESSGPYQFVLQQVDIYVCICMYKYV